MGALAVVAVLASVAGCSGGDDPVDTISAQSVRLGRTVRLAGSTIVVRSFDPKAGRAQPNFSYATATVAACTSPGRGSAATLDPAMFALETGDGRRVRGRVGRMPSLEPVVLPPGRCGHGLVTFVLRDSQQPIAVLYLGRTRLRWIID